MGPGMENVLSEVTRPTKLNVKKQKIKTETCSRALHKKISILGTFSKIIHLVLDKIWEMCSEWKKIFLYCYTNMYVKQYD